jgi:hypothetical protein
MMMLLLVQCFFTSQARPVDEVTESGKLVVFAYSDYAPYSWVGEDGPQGIDVEIARYFGRALGVEVEFLIRGADENFDDDLGVNIWKGDLIHGKTVDVMMHAPFDREVDIRNEYIVLTAPYFQEQMALVFNKAIHPTVETFGRFVSKPIAVEVDTAGEFFYLVHFVGSFKRVCSVVELSRMPSVYTWMAALLHCQVPVHRWSGWLFRSAILGLELPNRPCRVLCVMDGLLESPLSTIVAIWAIQWVTCLLSLLSLARFKPSMPSTA